MKLNDLAVSDVFRKPNCGCRLIAFEGVDGSGKSSICEALDASFDDTAFVKIPQEYMSPPFKEYLSFRASQIANALIYTASLADRKVMCDALDRSILFAVMDRSIWSTVAQSYVKYPEKTKDVLSVFETVSQYVPIPETVFVMDTPYEVCRDRVMRRCSLDRRFDSMSKEEYLRHMDFYYWLETQNVGVKMVPFNSMLSVEESVQQIRLQIRGNKT